MRINHWTAVFGLGLVLLGGVSVARAVEKATAQEAEQAAADWLDNLDDGELVIEERLEEGGFEVKGVAGPNSVMLVLSQDGWYITVGFSSPIDADTPLATVQERLSYVSLDRLPTPGLEVEGWEIFPRTPTSAIRDKEQISITGFADGRLTLHVETSCFALSGRDPSVRVPADAPMPPGSYFQLRRQFPLTLDVQAPVIGSAG